MSNLVLKQYRTEESTYMKAKKIAKGRGFSMSELHRLLDQIVQSEQSLHNFLDLRPRENLYIPTTIDSQQLKDREKLLVGLHKQNPRPAKTLDNDQMDEIIYAL